jgi:hypothetical protein
MRLASFLGQRANKGCPQFRVVGGNRCFVALHLEEYKPQEVNVLASSGQRRRNSLQLASPSLN